MQLFIEMGGRKGFAEQSLAVKVKVPWGGGMVGQWEGGMVSSGRISFWDVPPHKLYSHSYQELEFVSLV